MTILSRTPTFHLDPIALASDPYPQLAEMQRRAPIAWVPELGATLITRFDDIDVCEKNTQVFQSSQPGGLMTRLMGHNMMRKDGTQHRTERKMVMPSLSQRAVRDHWNAAIGDLVSGEVAMLGEKLGFGPVDIVRGFATRVSGRVLSQVTGLVSLSPSDMDWASQSMINGVANFAGDPVIEARCVQATAFLDQAIHRAMRDVDVLPPASMIRLLVESGAPIHMIQNNVKLAISGGQNETRDVLAGTIWAVLHHQLDSKLANWHRVFDEYVRWMAPIGMSPRMIGKDFDYGGVHFAKGSTARLMFGIANRDPSRFTQSADDFRPDLDRPQHMAFGAGPHFCAGAFVSRMAIAGQALPQVFQALDGLTLVGEPRFHGWAFRGPTSVRVAL